MKRSLIPFGVLFLFLGLVGCGESNSLTSSEIAYIRAKRLQELYGTGSATTTTISTTVTITSVATVSSTTTVY